LSQDNSINSQFGAKGVRTNNKEDAYEAISKAFPDDTRASAFAYIATQCHLPIPEHDNGGKKTKTTVWLLSKENDAEVIRFWNILERHPGWVSVIKHLMTLGWKVHTNCDLLIRKMLQMEKHDDVRSSSTKY